MVLPPASINTLKKVIFNSCGLQVVSCRNVAYNFQHTTFNIEEDGKKRQQGPGNIRVYRAQRKRYAGHVSLYHHQEQEKYDRKTGTEEIQSRSA